MGESRSSCPIKEAELTVTKKGCTVTKRALFTAPSPFADGTVRMLDRVLGRLGVKVAAETDGIAAKATAHVYSRLWWLRVYSTVSSLIWPHVPFSRSFCVSQVLHNLEHLCLTFPRYDANTDIPLLLPSRELPWKFLAFEKALRTRNNININHVVMFWIKTIDV